jgi:hypothetical protein
MIKRKVYPIYEYQISRNLYEQMLPKLDLVENHFATNAITFKQKCINQDTIVNLIFLLKEKSLEYGCIHLGEIHT